MGKQFFFIWVIDSTNLSFRLLFIHTHVNLYSSLPSALHLCNAKPISDHITTAWRRFAWDFIIITFINRISSTGVNHCCVSEVGSVGLNLCFSISSSCNCLQSLNIFKVAISYTFLEMVNFCSSVFSIYEHVIFKDCQGHSRIISYWCVVKIINVQKYITTGCREIIRQSFLWWTR